MQELLKGTCQFVVIEDVSPKTNKPYKRIKLQIGDYEVKNLPWVSDELFYILNSKAKKEM